MKALKVLFAFLVIAIFLYVRPDGKIKPVIFLNPDEVTISVSNNIVLISDGKRKYELDRMYRNVFKALKHARR